MSEDVPTKAPRVSVCILSHRRHFLPMALASVWRQTFTDYEIIVKHAAPYWQDKLNSLVRASSGEFIVVLCDDDELDPRFLERHVAEADRTHADIVYSDVAVIGAYESHPVFKGQRVHIGLPAFDAETLRMHCVPYVTALTRRRLWERLRDCPCDKCIACDGYDGAQPYLDWDLWLRAYSHGATAHHLRGEYLFWPRTHEANGSKLMDNPDALRRLRLKHAALAQPPVVP